MAEEKRWFEKHAPEMAEAYWNYYNIVEGETSVDKLTKALIALAVVITRRCQHCTEYRIKAALAAGATKQQISEVIMQTAIVSGGVELFWAKDVYDKYLG